MAVLLTRYEKIGIVRISGPVSASIIKGLSVKLRSLKKDLKTIIIDMSAAKIAPDAETPLAKLISEDRNYFAVAKSSATGVFQTIEHAFDRIPGPEAAMVKKIVVMETKMKKLNQKKVQLDAALSAYKVTSVEDVEEYLRKLIQQNRQSQAILTALKTGLDKLEQTFEELGKSLKSDYTELKATQKKVYEFFRGEGIRFQ